MGCDVQEWEREGKRGKVADVPFGQEFHTSSLTRPTVVSGTNAIDLRRPETSKNCTSVCGTCGTMTAAASAGTTSSGPPSGGAGGAGAPPPLLLLLLLPPPPPPGTAPTSHTSMLSPAAVPGRVLFSTRVNEVRVLAGSTAISTGMELVNVGREVLRCGEAR